MSQFKHWVRARWLELRLGFSSYLTYGIAFYNLVVLTSLRFGGFGLSAYLALGIGLSTIAIMVGHGHLKWQQTTDVRMEYEWIVEETAKRVVEKLKDEKQ